MTQTDPLPPVIEHLALAKVRLSKDCQSRAMLDAETIEEYAYRLKEGATFPPIVVFSDGTGYWMAVGFHRFSAWKALARERGDEETAEVPVDVRQGTVLDRPTLTVWSDAIYALEKIIEAMNATRGFGVPLRAMPRIRELIAVAAGILDGIELQPETDAEARG